MRFSPLLILALLTHALPAHAAFSVTLKDPKGDDDGPGSYTYPTDAVYTRGSFDLVEMSVKEAGPDIQIDLTFDASIEDPWGMAKQGGANFSTQFVQVYVDTDHKPKSGETQAIAGMNATFADESAFEKVILISPQPAARVRSEVAQKSPKHKAMLVVPRSVSAKGKTITALVSKKDLGEPKASWGWQALVSSNEGYPDAKDVLNRKVNEFEGPHRFGGGMDADDDPHFMDMLVSPAKGGDAEKDAQHKLLKPNKDKWAKPVLPMVYGG
ncbi:MAG: glucodextranase DOMON-like domain-containing protein [Myxococcota bacterium]